MKKGAILFLISLLLLSTSLVYAQDFTPPTITGEQDITATKEGTEKIIDAAPVDKETGEIDKEKLKLQKSKAEQRIEKINNWTKENAGWLVWVFGMVPEISWLFAINVLIILIFINGFILNSANVFIMLSRGIAKLVGIGVFLFLLLTRILTNVFARPMAHLTTKWWGFLLIILALIVANPILSYYFKNVSEWKERGDKKKIKEKSEEAEEKAEEAQEKTEKVVKALTEED